MNKAFIRYLTGIAVFATALAASAEPINQPSWKVGDRWKYLVRDDYTGLAQAPLELVITNIDDKHIQATENGAKALYTADLNPIELPDRTFSPPAGAIRFPMSVGNQWNWKGTFTLKSNGKSYTSSYDVAVKERVSISVPAGTFEAVRLEMSGYFEGQAFLRQYWYSPVARGYVRITNEAPKNRWTRELVEFSLKD